MHKTKETCKKYKNPMKSNQNQTNNTIKSRRTSFHWLRDNRLFDWDSYAIIMIALYNNKKKSKNHLKSHNIFLIKHEKFWLKQNWSICMVLYFLFFFLIKLKDCFRSIPIIYIFISYIFLSGNLIEKKIIKRNNKNVLILKMP